MYQVARATVQPQEKEHNMMTPFEIVVVGIGGWLTIELIAIPWTLRAWKKRSAQIEDLKREATHWQETANRFSEVATNAKAELGQISGLLGESDAKIVKMKEQLRSYIKVCIGIAKVAHMDKNDCIHVRSKKTGRMTPVKFEIVEE